MMGNVFENKSTHRYSVRILGADSEREQDLVTSSRLDIVAVDGGSRRTIAAQNGRFFSHPAWSPDGRWIAFDNYPHEDWGWVTVVRPTGPTATT